MADIHFQAQVAGAGVQVDTENSRLQRARELRAEREMAGRSLEKRQVQPHQDTVDLSEDALRLRGSNT